MAILIATTSLRLGNIKQGDCTPLTPKKNTLLFLRKLCHFFKKIWYNLSENKIFLRKGE